MSAEMPRRLARAAFFFFNDTATTEIYTLSLHDALPICLNRTRARRPGVRRIRRAATASSSIRIPIPTNSDRKSTRLNSSHSQISYAGFCLKKNPSRPGIDPLLATLGSHADLVVAGVDGH